MKSPNGDLCIGERVVIFPPRVEAQLSTQGVVTNRGGVDEGIYAQ